MKKHGVFLFVLLPLTARFVGPVRENVSDFQSFKIRKAIL